MAFCRVNMGKRLVRPVLERRSAVAMRSKLQVGVICRTQPWQRHYCTAETAATGDSSQPLHTLLVTRDDDTGIVTVAPNRPHKRNAINRSMWDEVGTVMQELDCDDSVRCIVLRANGPGADISEFRTERSVRDTGSLTLRCWHV